MQFNYSYQKDSLVNHRTSSSSVSFAPDTLRQPTYFRGKLRKNIAFREGISALHDVVVSDLKWKPKDRTAYLEWLSQQDEIDWAAVAGQRKNVADEIARIREELSSLQATSHQRLKTFRAAQQKYFNYIYTRDKDAWYVLDPVITVHPDELFFECFSRDESSYGRLGVNYNTFADVGEFACGTTNIDYSAALYDEFQKIRSYKETSFEIDPSGFELQTGGDAAHKETKIDLPDSWVRGFLQVSSAMALPAVTFKLHPMDVHNICFVLRRNREKKGPRSLRYQLKPGHPVRIVFDPWNITLDCPRSIYQGHQEEEVRVWGRRRIHILERLIPVARSFTVQLLGKGMPSFYTADLGDMAFTLGLSGWTANDWSSEGNFDLLAPRAIVDDQTKLKVFQALSENWFESADSLAHRLQLDKAVVLGALAAWIQAGRAIYDNNGDVYRVRELTREPLPMDQLRFRNEREEHATRFLTENAVNVTRNSTTDTGLQMVEGTVTYRQKTYTTSLTLDSDERMLAAACTCNWHQQNQLRKGPCEHILAVRMKSKQKGRLSNLFTSLGITK